MQNFIELSAAVHELSCSPTKNSGKNNNVVVTADSKNVIINTRFIKRR